MPDLVDGAAEEQVSKKAVPVRGHCDEVAFLALGGLEDFRGGLAERQTYGYLGDTPFPQVPRRPLQIRPVRPHLLGFGQVQPLVIARHPAVGHMDQQQLRADGPGQLRDVRQERQVGAPVFQGDQYLLIHRSGEPFR